MHCLKQFKGEGGDNQFVDGFAVGQHLSRNHPEEWKLLTNTKFTFSDVGSDSEAGTKFYTIYKTPIFR